MSLSFATALAFNAPTEGFPRDDLRKILHGGQTMAKVGLQNGEEILQKVSTAWVERTKVTDDMQTTDGFAIAKTRTQRSHVRVKTAITDWIIIVAVAHFVCKSPRFLKTPQASSGRL